MMACGPDNCTQKTPFVRPHKEVTLVAALEIGNGLSLQRKAIDTSD